MLVSQGDFNRRKLAYRHNVDVTAMGEFGVLLRLRRGGGSKNLRGCVKGERGLFYVYTVIDEEGREVKKFVHGGANKEQVEIVKAHELKDSEKLKDSEESEKLKDSEDSEKLKDKWRGDHKEKDYRRKGNYGEMKVDIDLEGSMRFKRINEDDRVLNLDQPTRRGIDGIYKAADPPPEYIIVEVKHTGRKPRTGKIKGGHRQLSNEWLRERLKSAVMNCPPEIQKDFDDINKVLKDHKNFKRVLAHIQEDGSIKYYQVKKDGNTLKRRGKAIEWKGK